MDSSYIGSRASKPHTSHWRCSHSSHVSSSQVSVASGVPRYDVLLRASEVADCATAAPSCEYRSRYSRSIALDRSSRIGYRVQSFRVRGSRKSPRPSQDPGHKRGPRRFRADRQRPTSASSIVTCAPKRRWPKSEHDEPLRTYRTMLAGARIRGSAQGGHRPSCPPRSLLLRFSPAPGGIAPFAGRRSARDYLFRRSARRKIGPLADIVLPRQRSDAFGVAPAGTSDAVALICSPNNRVA